MPTLALKVQQDGFHRGWSALVFPFGEASSFGYLAVDDSDGVTHDGASTYLTLPRLAAPNGRVSFPMFLQAEGLVPSSITLNVVARRGGASHPQIQIGFYRAGLTGFDAVAFDPGASFSLAQRTFSTNPITGLPWSASDLVGLEAMLQSENAAGNNDVTLLSGSITYIENKSWRGIYAPGSNLLS